MSDVKPPASRTRHAQVLLLLLSLLLRLLLRIHGWLAVSRPDILYSSLGGCKMLRVMLVNSLKLSRAGQDRHR